MVNIIFNGENIKVSDRKIAIDINDGDIVYCGKQNAYISQFNLNQVVKLKFKDTYRGTGKEIEQLATVRGIHFYEGKVKYDLALWLGDGSVDNPEWESRIYNVDSILLTPV